MKTSTTPARPGTGIGALSFLVSIAALSVLPALALGAEAVSSERTRHLKVSGGTLAYDDSGGAGPVVICVPGMGDLRAQYRFLEPRLAAAGYRVITMDVRGQGDSSTDWTEWDAPAVGRDVLGLMNALGIQKAHLVGNSFAAGSVYWAAVQEPERVASLTLLGPAMRDGKPNPVMGLALRVGLSGFWGPGFWLGYWDGLFPVKKPADFAEYRAALLRNLREPRRIASLKRLALASKAPIESILGKATAPVLLVMGTKDKDFPDPAAEAQLIGGKTRARVQMVDSGHYPHVEEPDQTAGIITAFLGAR
jgi:pimeloyl-ACP methyl ester carboxylesterase